MVGGRNEKMMYLVERDLLLSRSSKSIKSINSTGTELKKTKKTLTRRPNLAKSNITISKKTRQRSQTARRVSCSAFVV